MSKKTKASSIQPPLETSLVSAKAALSNETETGSCAEKSPPQSTLPATTPLESVNNKSSSCSLSEEAAIDTFIALVEQGIDAWKKAGHVLVQLVNKGGVGTLMDITAKCPWLTANLLWQFYRIGTGEIYPKVLVICRNAGVSRRLAVLPYSKQVEICEKGIPVAENGSDGRMRLAAELTLKDVNLAISQTGCIRTVKQQCEILNAREKKFKASSSKPVNTYVPPPVVRPMVKIGRKIGDYKLVYRDGRLSLQQCKMGMNGTERIVPITLEPLDFDSVYSLTISVFAPK